MMDVNVLLGIVLGLVSFGIGSSLRFFDFVKIFRYPKSLTLGLIMQMIFLPLLTVSILSFSSIDPMLKMGIVVLSLCPGGTTSNFISYLLHLETALSVLLTSINSLLILITIPLGLQLASQLYLGSAETYQIPLWDTLLQVFTVVLIPAFFGLLVNRYLPRLSEKMQQALKVINTILLITVFALKLFLDPDSGGSGLVWKDFITVGPILILTHLISLLLSYYLALKLVKNTKIGITIGVEVGLQNTVLALFIVSTITDNPIISKPALIMAGFSFFTTITFAYLMKRYGTKIKSKDL